MQYYVMSTISLLFRQLDNGYQDNVKCKMVEILLQAFAVLARDRLHPVTINVCVMSDILFCVVRLY